MAEEEVAIANAAVATTSYQSSKFKTLYEKCLNCYVLNLNYNVSTLDGVQQLRYLPPEVLIDVYVMMSKHVFLHDMLFEQLSDLEIFERLLRFDPARQKLFRCISILIGNKKPLGDRLQENFTARHECKEITKKLASTKIAERQKASKATTNTAIGDSELENSPAAASTAATATSSTEKTAEDDGGGDDQAPAHANELEEEENEVEQTERPLKPADVDFGLRLGSFLSEAGWLAPSIKVLSCVAKKLERSKNSELKSFIIQLDCLQRLLHSEQALGSFKTAERTFKIIVKLLKEVNTDDLPKSLLANTYTQFSALYFSRSEYDDSHMWSIVAMRHLERNTPERIAVDVLRQASKACVVKRDFQRANMLICQATRRACKVFGQKHQKYADSLLDYGFFLLNVDSVSQSVNVYKEALDIKRAIFGNRNYHVAVAHEDLSYAYYVHEYSTGNFTCARENVENAIDIMQELVPHDHLKLASAKRVKALLLEEIALDKITEGIDEDGDNELLRQSEELHKFALQLSLDVFGEINVQTAKHYGNLGRLYQTMRRFDEAESMHLKAIRIKTDLLGEHDYEVGLSIGHLASLYNYQMQKYREAERLYLRSIEISLRLFGRSYSGLEYDYLGLCHVYETLREFEKYLKYATILENWQALRGQNDTLNKSIYPAITEDCSLEDVKFKFFNMCTENITACN